ncbi:MAG: amidohydrolase [Gammaproteobacteria bacterium AqS3]|nr:amidohydrolase [Gammaproteobacteria bacterium AqS3]
MTGSFAGAFRAFLTAFLLLGSLIGMPGAAAAAEAPNWRSLEKIYRQLHSSPELSNVENQTAKFMAEHFRKLGFTVTEGIGGTGVVGVLRNGSGPTLMLRADMDALPVLEETGAKFASKVRMKNSAGVEQPVMHACGHDIHMTSLIGTLQRLVSIKDSWSGTLIAIAQPAEEVGQGARNMLADGLFTKFPRPDYNLALHVSSALPSDSIAYTPGYALANVDSVDIIVHGVGGHGAYPNTTKDPVVLASSIVGSLQTIVSRELSPLTPAVVTVGAFHAGHKHNVISNRAHLQLTVRSYSQETRQQIFSAIRRIVRGQGMAAGLPEDLLPEVKVQDEYTPSAFNNPELAERLAGVWRDKMGAAKTVKVDPVMGGEDFGRYGQVEPKIPSVIFWLGGVSRKTFEKAMQTQTPLPSLHSSTFLPDYKTSLRTGVEATTAAALELLGDE